MFDTKKQIRWSKIKVGLVITIALLAILTAVFFAGNIQNLFLQKVNLKVQFHDIEGLRSGAPVWILGIEEGTVKDLKLDPFYGVIVDISIRKNALRYLKKDSEATILTMGLLGDKYIELSTGSPGAQPINPWEMIKGTTQKGMREVMETSANTIGKMTEVIDKLDRIVTDIAESQGTIPKLFSDPALYNNLKEATGKITLLIDEVKNSLDEIKNSRGTLKMLMEDPSLYKKAIATASELEEFGRTINKGSGTFKKLIEDPSLYNHMATAASDLEAFTRKLKEGHGTLGKLLENPELYDNFNKDLKQISSILERIDKGEGLAGAFTRNSELAKELEETVVELKNLLKDIKEHPKKFFKFSIF